MPLIAMIALGNAIDAIECHAMPLNAIDCPW